MATIESFLYSGFSIAGYSWLMSADSEPLVWTLQSNTTCVAKPLVNSFAPWNGFDLELAIFGSVALWKLCFEMTALLKMLWTFQVLILVMPLQG